MDDLISVRSRTGSIYDQNFGLGLKTEDLHHPRYLITAPLRAGYLRPWRHHTLKGSSAFHLKKDHKRLKFDLDVQQFKPHEIVVKVVDNFVVVEGKHEERKDEHGSVSRHFQRRYRIPDDVDPETIISKISSDGVLSIESTEKIHTPNTERVIPIMHTNGSGVLTEKPLDIKDSEERERSE